MDLQDFEAQALYFDAVTPVQVTELIQQASENYSSGGAESFLLNAYKMAPENLEVLVALYRFYYYQHRYQDAIETAFKAMKVVEPAIGFPSKWNEITFNDLANGVMESFTMVRFYLLALKGAAYLNLRMGNMELGVRMLNKVIELDSSDRLGAKTLLQSIGPAPIEQSSEAAVSAGS